MRLQEHLQRAYDTFMEAAQDSRLILLHPDSRFRSMLVAKLMSDNKLDSFYYAIGPDDVNLQSFLNSITAALSNQHATFGRNTNILPRYMLEQPNRNFDTVLATFLQDITELSDRNFLLILDEYDLSDRADEVQRFVERLSNHFPSHGRIVLNSRSMPRLPLLSMMAQNRTSIIKDDEVILDDFYGRSNDEKDAPGTLQIYTMGPGYVTVDGNMIDTWEGHLPRLLFFFALDRPLVTRAEICSAFWPELDSDQAVNVFHVTKRRLHKALDHDVLVHTDGYYQVNPDLKIYYDALEFVDTLIAARRTDNPGEKMAHWQHAMTLYRGPFLKGHTDQWIIERREEFRDGAIDALLGMTEAYRKENNSEMALATLQKAAEADPSREDIHREVMGLFAELGRRGEAAAYYKKLVTAFKSEKKTISPETEAFYQSLNA